MITKYFRTEAGAFIGGLSGVLPPAGAIEVPTAPEDARQVWANDAWGNAPAQAYRLYKSSLIRRLSEQEAIILKAVLDAAPTKSQMLWAASEWLGSDDPLFTTMSAAIGQALGASRAAEILAAE